MSEFTGFSPYTMARIPTHHENKHRTYGGSYFEALQRSRAAKRPDEGVVKRTHLLELWCRLEEVQRTAEGLVAAGIQRVRQQQAELLALWQEARSAPERGVAI